MSSVVVEEKVETPEEAKQFSDISEEVPQDEEQPLAPELPQSSKGNQLRKLSHLMKILKRNWVERVRKLES